MALSGIINTATTTTLVTAVAAKERWYIGLSNNSANTVTVDIMVGPTGATVACPKSIVLYKAGSNLNNYQDFIPLNEIGDKIQVVTTTTDIVTYRTGGGV